jgi:hypothetical protein
MRFTANELKSIEATMSKLRAVANTMWASESTDASNARAIDFIISEMRLCAILVASDDRATRVAGYDRLDSMLKAQA